MKRIVSFEKVTLRESGMRGSVEYEMVSSEDGAEVLFYYIRYNGGEDERVLDNRAVCGVEEALAILNGCKIMSWDGFDGPHPRGVLDGIMFRFEAAVNGGEKITARGSQNFPRHYREFRDGLYSILHGGE
ncbi:MAG: hypothetical protein IJQ80_03680 [Clostridia bacterium]|nr:hypothetical protein [Clostridia bacterium]